MGYTRPVYYGEGYSIFFQGTNVLAVRNIDGTVLVNTTDVGIAFNSCIANMVNGGRIFLYPGTYTLKTPVVTGLKCVEIEGNSGGITSVYTSPVCNIVLDSTLAANWAFAFGDDSDVIEGGGMRNISIYGQGHTTHKGCIYVKNHIFSNWENLYLSSLWNTVANTYGYGIFIETTNSKSGYAPCFKNIRAYQCRVGLHIGLSVHNALNIGGWFVGRTAGATIGIEIDGTETHNPDTFTSFGGDLEQHKHADGVGLRIVNGMSAQFYGLRTEDNQKDIVIENTSSGLHRFNGGNWYSAIGGYVPFTDSGTNASRINDVSGFKTENRGTSTGTGAQQTIAHGLGITPNIVYITPTATGAVETSQTAAADATNIYLTVTNLKTYQWHAQYLA